MGSVFALLAIIFAAYIVVTAGGIAYELTGLDRETARFQALSAFTGTGFTTSISAKVVDHPVRRRITMLLIVLGWAGAGGLIVTMLESLDVDSVYQWLWHIGVAVSGGLLGWYVFRRRGWDQPLMDWLRRQLMPRLTREEVPHEDLFTYQEGIGIVRIEVPPNSRCVGRTLRDLELPRHQLQVLLVEHEDHSVAVPGPDELIKERAHLVLFGRLSAIEDVFRHEDDDDEPLRLSEMKRQQRRVGG